jgi:hypothetical protein
MYYLFFQLEFSDELFSKKQNIDWIAAHHFKALFLRASVYDR